jgi:hypothetical protein
MRLAESMNGRYLREAAMDKALSDRLARHQETIQAICREVRDLLMADGDPLAHIRLIEDPVRNLSSL